MIGRAMRCVAWLVMSVGFAVWFGVLWLEDVLFHRTER